MNSFEAITEDRSPPSPSFAPFYDSTDLRISREREPLQSLQRSDHIIIAPMSERPSVATNISAPEYPQSLRQHLNFPNERIDYPPRADWLPVGASNPQLWWENAVQDGVDRLLSLTQIMSTSHRHPTASVTQSEVLASLWGSMRPGQRHRPVQAPIPRTLVEHVQVGHVEQIDQQPESLQSLTSLISELRSLVSQTDMLWKQDEMKQIRMRIESTSTAKLAPKLNETELIQELVGIRQHW